MYKFQTKYFRLISAETWRGTTGEIQLKFVDPKSSFLVNVVERKMSELKQESGFLESGKSIALNCARATGTVD